MYKHDSTIHSDRSELVARRPVVDGTAFDEGARQQCLDSERRLREQREEIQQGPVPAYDRREALRLACDVALRRLRALPTGELSDAELERAFQAGGNEIDGYVVFRSNWLGTMLSRNGMGRGSLAQTYVDCGNLCAKRAREELRRELEAYRAERLRQAQGSSGPSDGRLPGEITLAEASKEFGVPAPEWSRAANRPPNDSRYLPHRRFGRNVLVQRKAARKFAEDHDARREQRVVGSQRSKH